MESSSIECLDFGKMGYGCKHYRRRCRKRVPCCNEVYSCRHCRNEATSMMKDPYDHHELVRQDVGQVVCSVYDTEQPVCIHFSSNKWKKKKNNRKKNNEDEVTQQTLTPNVTTTLYS